MEPEADAFSRKGKGEFRDGKLKQMEESGIMVFICGLDVRSMGFLWLICAILKTKTVILHEGKHSGI